MKPRFNGLVCATDFLRRIQNKQYYKKMIANLQGEAPQEEKAEFPMMTLSMVHGSAFTREVYGMSDRLKAFWLIPYHSSAKVSSFACKVYMS